MSSLATQTEQQALSVSDLTAQLKGHLETGFPSVWVTGEISNFARPQSGHCYFTLKDDGAQIRAVLWRSTAARVKVDLADGLEIIGHGHIDVYGARGTYQLVLDRLEPKGVGALELSLRKLREKLTAEGLFDRSRKQPLPPFPRRVAFVTSPTGAAIRDFLEVLRRRWSGASVLVIPARVQGSSAAAEIVAGILAAGRLRPAPDVLVVGRGGGSLEDLWCFNDESVVRALAASKIPTVSAVGHEIDVTLADLAADVRALTPSEAAERVVPAADEIQTQMRGHGQRLLNTIRRYVTTFRTRLDALATQRSFRQPLEIIHDRSRWLDEWATRATTAVQRNIRDRKAEFYTQAGKLESLSPLGVLKRGYSITQDAKTGRVIRQSSQLRKGQLIISQFAVGKAKCTVDEVSTKE